MIVSLSILVNNSYLYANLLRDCNHFNILPYRIICVTHNLKHLRISSRQNIILNKLINKEERMITLKHEYK